MKIEVKHIESAFSDARGDIIDVFEGTVHHTGIITFAKDAVRANHYHKEQTQYTYMLSGKIELKTKQADNPHDPVSSVIMETGDFVELPPHTIHSYQALEDSSMICLTTKMRDSTSYEEDTVRVEAL